MLTIAEAFRKFRSQLELTKREREDASRRQKEVRGVMSDSFRIECDFLTGSYKRWTKTKPLKDVDIFCVFHDDERDKYRNDKSPHVILVDTQNALSGKYGSENVVLQRRSVSVRFPKAGDEEIMSFDVVPAFTKSDHYEIADTTVLAGWIETNPKIHAELVTEKNKSFDGEWVGMVRMIKRWNEEAGKPVKPSFLLEVMALDLLRSPFGGDYPYEFMAFFASAAERVDDTWEDPAGLGPPVSDAMDDSAREAARTTLTSASHTVREAIELSRAGRNGAALRKYREDLFGSRFPLS